MTGRIDSRLAELGIVLPSELEPAGNYVGCVITVSHQGFIKRTPRGRVATAHAYDHLGLPVSGDHDLGFYAN